MKKVILGAFVLSFILAGCNEKEKEANQIKAIAENMVSYIQAVIDKPQLKDDEAYFKEFMDRQKNLCEDLSGKTIPIEIEEGLGIELESPEGKIGKVFGDTKVTIPVNLDLKIKDADIAFKTINNLMALVCDKEGNAIDALYIGSANNLETGFAEVDSIEEVVDTGEPIKIENPYKNGDVLCKGTSICIDPVKAQPFVNATKLIVKKYDYDLISEIRGKLEAIEQETIKKMKNIDSVSPQETENNNIKDSSEAELGRGDLGIFELRGPVKTMKNGQTYTFNEKGQWLTLDGQKLSTLYYQVVRDKNGRLSELNADGYGSVSYTFNTNGLATSINEDGFARELTYNKDGDVIKEVQITAPEMGDEEGDAEKATYIYEIIERDQYGNWIKRKVNAKNIETRTITYFE